MSTREALSTPTTLDDVVTECAPSMPIRAFPFVTERDSQIHIGQTAPTESSGGLTQLVQAVRVPIQFGRALVGATWTSTSFKNLARFDIPPVPVRAFEVVTNLPPQILAFEANQIVPCKSVEKLLLNRRLRALLASCRATCYDGGPSLKLVTAGAPQKIVSVGTTPLRRQ
ncbi:hypothetical protein [Burkholderia metallica]|uniref:hypothetical protein n=1 Tax=Burkholderia metallica TaxID=488729 RepID=UPI001CF3AE22|nr:hypothetical protein [Burkholderia metallica]MCA8023617.1 hypothetical protein [Burkholderia metallica]